MRVHVKCLTQEHNTMSPARAQTQSARSGVECTNHEATALTMRPLRLPRIIKENLDAIHNNCGSDDLKYSKMFSR